VPDLVGDYRRGFRTPVVYFCAPSSKISGLQIIGETTNDLDAVQQIKNLNPELILMDVNLPTLHGIEAFRRISQLNPESKVYSLAKRPSADIVREVLNAGALGYVFKTKAASELPQAMEAVLGGHLYVSGGRDSRD